MSCKCAHCNSVIDNAAFGAECLTVRVTPKQAKILRRLIAAQGTLLMLDELVDAAYGDRIDGGPLNARMTTKQGLYFLKHRVRSVGYDVVNVRGFGYRLERSNIIPIGQRRKYAV